MVNLTDLGSLSPTNTYIHTWNQDSSIIIPAGPPLPLPACPLSSVHQETFCSIQSTFLVSQSPPPTTSR
ncbi:hypothetical protein CRENBAI_004458 [Crenichthys baileyi]|uniref:Uncharacterized protein n=1 Tax=Crenichthys baileyi TaxID=28760 RepID=A0AAV9RKI7_9TELE